MQIFEKHQHWQGHYQYNKTVFKCTLFVHSEHYRREDGILATFNDENGATIEFEGLLDQMIFFNISVYMFQTMFIVIEHYNSIAG